MEPSARSISSRRASRPQRSAQHDQLGHCVGPAPDDGVLRQAVAQGLGSLQGQAEDEAADLAWPLVRRVLAYALDGGPAALRQLAQQGHMQLRIAGLVDRLAPWIAGGDEGCPSGKAA